MVEIHFEDTEVLDASPEFFHLWLSDLVSREGWELGDLNLVFCSDDYLLDMNRRHLNHDYYTDIITFDYTTEETISGDLFISVDRVRENALENDAMFHVERNRVVCHGVLHLMGYKDKSDEDQKEMTQKEDWALSLIVSRET